MCTLSTKMSRRNVSLRFSVARASASYRTVDVVLEDGGFIDCWEITGATNKSLIPRFLTPQTYPLVKTFSNEVFPHAPSPLINAVQVSASPMSGLGGGFDAQQHQLTLDGLGTSAERRHRGGSVKSRVVEEGDWANSSEESRWRS